MIEKEVKHRKARYIVSFLLITLLFSGCIGVDRSFRGMRDYILEYSKNQFEKEFEFSLGNISIGMAEIALNFAETDEPIDEILSEIDNVQVGIYNNLSNYQINVNIEELKFITNKMENAGWNCIVKTLNNDEITAIFVRFSEDELNQLFVISVNKSELVLVEVLGNLNKVIEVAIREKGFNFAMNH